MKNILFTIAIFLLAGFISVAQTTEKKLSKLPSIKVKTLDGKSINTADLGNDGKPFIISFWALWCKPCIKELTAIAEVYEEWQQETGVKIYAVSIDDARSSSRVKPTVDGNNWAYDVLLDANSDFKRAMNVNMIPHMFIINGKGEIVWQHTSFADGGELEVIDVVRKVLKGEDVSN